MTTLQSLNEKRCRPCAGGTPPLDRSIIERFLQVLPSWTLSSHGRSIQREFLMKDFSSAVDLIAAIRDVAEAEDHHPDVHLTGYRKLTIELSTHAIGGLSENDFVLAAKIEYLPKNLKF